MKKNARRKQSNQEGRVPEQRTLQLATVIRHDLYRFVIQEGLKAFDQMLEEDRERLCGPVKAKGSSGAPVRRGHTDARLSMGGRRVVVSRPRVRQSGKEVALLLVSLSEVLLSRSGQRQGPGARSTGAHRQAVRGRRGVSIDRRSYPSAPPLAPAAPPLCSSCSTSGWITIATRSTRGARCPKPSATTTTNETLCTASSRMPALACTTTFPSSNCETWL